MAYQVPNPKVLMNPKWLTRISLVKLSSRARAYHVPDPKVLMNPKWLTKKNKQVKKKNAIQSKPQLEKK